MVVTAPTLVRRPRPIRRTVSRSAVYAIAIGVALVVVVPFVYAVLGGFRTTGQLAARPVDLPSPWVFEI